MKRSSFGVEVKTELIRLGKTSRNLAQTIGLADSTICDVIAGRNQSDKTKQRIKMVLKQWREEDSKDGSE